MAALHSRADDPFYTGTRPGGSGCRVGLAGDEAVALEFVEQADEARLVVSDGFGESELGAGGARG
jgi:hypothetical protein